MLSGSAPMQPVTMTLPFSFSALPMAVERLRLGAVEKAAGVDDDEVRAGVLARQLITLRAQPRDDALAVDQRLRAAERDEAHLGGGGFVVRIKHAGLELVAIRGDSKAADVTYFAKPRPLRKTSFPRPSGCPCPPG